MWVRPVETDQILERLRRIVEAPVFRFVLVQALPQSDIGRDIKDFLEQSFKDLPKVKEINLRKTDYRALLKIFEDTEQGFVLFHNFEHLLHDPDLYIGFNQRRDRFAAKPIAIIAILPTGVETMRLVQDRIPDFWSLRAAVLEIKYRYLPEIKTYYQPRFRNPEPDTRTFEEKERTVIALGSRLADLQLAAQNLDAIVAVCRELALLCKDLGQPTEALRYADTALALVQSSALVSEQYYALNFQLLKSDILIEQGDFEGADTLLTQVEKAALDLQDTPTWYEARYLQALCYLDKSQPEGALTHIAQTLLQTIEVLSQPPDINTLVKLQTLHGLAYLQSGEWNTAYRLLAQYVTEAKGKYLSPHVETILVQTEIAAHVLSKYGNSFMIFGGYSLSETRAENAADYPFSELLWGSSWFFQGLETDYEAHFTNAQRVFAERYGPNHILVADTLYHWGQYLFFKKGPYPRFIPGRSNEFSLWKPQKMDSEIKTALEKALEQFEHAKKIYEGYFVYKHSKIIYIEVFIAFIHLYLGNFKVAKTQFESIVHPEKDNTASNDYLMAICYFGLGRIFEHRGLWSTATGCYAIAYHKVNEKRNWSLYLTLFPTESYAIGDFMEKANRKSPKTYLGRFWERIRGLAL